MKVILLIFSSLLFSFLLSSCSESNLNSDMIKLSVPSLDKNGEYSFSVVEVPRPQSMKSMKSDFVQFSAGPPQLFANLNTNGIDVVLNQPEFSFIERNNVYYPSGDIYSLEAASLYYLTYKTKTHLEKIGFNLKDFWPRKIALNTFGKNNASYYTKSDTLYAIRTNTANKIAMAFNENVYLHEFFHAIFFNTLYQSYKEKFKTKTQLEFFESEYFSRYLRFTSLNEGLADLFSYSVSGLPSIFKHFNEGGEAYRNFHRKKFQKRPRFFLVSRADKYRNGEFFSQRFLELSLNLKNYEIDVKKINSSEREKVLKNLLKFTKTSVSERFLGLTRTLNEKELESLIESEFKITNSDKSELKKKNIDTEKPIKKAMDFTNSKKGKTIE